MPLKERREITDDELMFGLLLLNKYWFLKFFWEADLTIPGDRLDLPPEWVGTQRISREQRLMMLDESENILFCTARKVAKTVCIEGSVIQHGITYTGDAGGEALLVTPGDHHLAPIRRRLSTKIADIPFFDMMVKSFNKAAGILEFNTGLIWWMRVEGQRKRGESQVSLRADYIIGDEMAFGGQVAYESRQQTKLPGAKQLYAGVPNGVRTSPFYQLDQTSMGDSWSRHSSRTGDYSSYINPLFQSKKARQDLIDSHGGENTQMYITQVKGQWGKEAYSSFPRIPIVMSLPFRHIELTEEQVNANLNDLSVLLALPVLSVEAGAWILGGDLGYSPAPTVLLIFYLKDGSWREFARIKLLRVNPLNQARIIDYLNTTVLPERFSVIALDAHQWGDAVLQTLHNDPTFGLSDNYRMKAIDVGFEGRVEDPRIKLHQKCKSPLRHTERGDWICDRCQEIVHDPQQIINARVPAKQYYTEQLKNAFAFANLYLDAQEQGA
jgi:hypothetical protein